VDRVGCLDLGFREKIAKFQSYNGEVAEEKITYGHNSVVQVLIERIRVNYEFFHDTLFH